MKAFSVVRCCQLLALYAFSSMCLAGIQVGGTRIIFPAADHEASVQVRNEGASDIMIQSWIEAASQTAQEDVPFAITPSLARLSHKKQQMLRIFYQGKGLPEDRESVFWLSVQEIPQLAESDNNLQVAFRQRLKLFYRPAQLPGSPDEAAKNLNWKLLNTAGELYLIAVNPSAFHVSFGEVKVIANDKEYALEAQMLSPGGDEKIRIKGLPGNFRGNAEVQWESINDYGALVKHRSTVML